MGAPHRLRYFREALEHIRKHPDALFWTGERIHDWFVAAHAAA
jgi:allantoinase